MARTIVTMEQTYVTAAFFRHLTVQRHQQRIASLYDEGHQQLVSGGDFLFFSLETGSSSMCRPQAVWRFQVGHASLRQKPAYAIQQPGSRPGCLQQCRGLGKHVQGWTLTDTPNSLACYAILKATSKSGK